MGPNDWIASLSTMLRETIIVAQFLVIVVQWRRNNAISEAHTTTVVALLKESREDNAETIKAMYVMDKSIGLNTEVLRRVDDHIRRS